MISIYTKNDYEKARELKAKLIKQALILAAVCLLVNVVIILFKFTVPWGQSTFWFQFANCVVTFAYAAWLIYFFGVPFKLIKQYCKFYRSATNLREKPESGIFLGMREDVEYRDGIDYYEMLFYPGQDDRGRERVSKVFFEADRPLPEIEIGDEVLAWISSGIIVAYEITKHQAVGEAELEVIREKINKKLGIITEEEIEQE